MVTIHDLLSLSGKIALVTGGTGWLGSQMVECLLELGATVYATSRFRSQSFLQDHDRLFITECDICDSNAVEKLLSDIVDKHAAIDILVNNAYSWPTVVDFEKTSFESIDKTLRTGLTAQLAITHDVFLRMKQSGGSIINIASMYGHVAPDHRIYHEVEGMGNAIEYGASKAAMIQATRYIASIGGKYGIRCNSVSPGPFPRPGALNEKSWFERELAHKTMLNRVATAEELKGVIALLASSAGSYITGVDIPVDGGWIAW